MQPSAVLLTVMILGPTFGQLAGMAYSGIFQDNWHTFFAAPYMHAGSIVMLAFGLVMFLLVELPRLRLTSSAGGFRLFHLLLLCLAIFALLNGLFHYWPTIGIVADTVYMITWVSTYFIGRFALSSDRPDEKNESRMERIWLRCAALCAIASLVGVPIGTTMFVVGASGVLTFIVALVYSMAFRRNYHTMLLLAAPLVVSIAQTNRTTILVVSLSFMICLAAGGMVRMGFRLLLAIGLLSGIFMYMHESLLDSMDMSETPLGRRISDLSEVSLDLRQDKGEVALSHRLFEVDLVLTQLGKGHWIFWVIGSGSGATLDMTQGRDYSITENSYLGGDKIHNIHFMPAAILYRFGFIGLAVYGYFGVVSLRAAYRAIRRARREKSASMELIAAMYLLMSITEGMFASGHFLTDWLPPFLAAYLDHMALSRKTAALESDSSDRVPARPGVSPADRAGIVTGS